MDISLNTKISVILKAHPQALTTIVSLNKNYKKLKNPFLRKILASRVTIADAAHIGGISVEEFIKPLLLLGFTFTDERKLKEERYEEVKGDITCSKVLDVREEIVKGKDPLTRILKSVRELQQQETLLLITSFLPTPLIKILQTKGYKVQSNLEDGDQIKTFITNVKAEPLLDKMEEYKKFESAKSSFGLNTIKLDVKDLKMPQPMLKILKILETLPEDNALHVFHKKVPLYLLPELQDLGYEIAISEKSENDVELFIYKKNSSKINRESNLFSKI